jgi:hypothetical protein
MKKSLLFIASVSLFATSSAFAGVNTIPAWNGTGFISAFGVVNTATYGQTITIPAGAGPLTDFTFQIGQCSAEVLFRASVYAWDGQKATGPSLYTSAVTTIPADAAFHAFTFNTGNLALSPGVYVLMASTSQDQTERPASACRWGALPFNSSVYAGGNFVFMNNGTDVAQWTTSTWSTFNDDLAFQANFTESGSVPATPLPPTLWLTLAGLGSGGAVTWLRSIRRKRA